MIGCAVRVNWPFINWFPDLARQEKLKNNLKNPDNIFIGYGLLNIKFIEKCEINKVNNQKEILLETISSLKGLGKTLLPRFFVSLSTKNLAN